MLKGQEKLATNTLILYLCKYNLQRYALLFFTI
jgi:hypothetical protein